MAATVFDIIQDSKMPIRHRMALIHRKFPGHDVKVSTLKAAGIPAVNLPRLDRWSPARKERNGEIHAWAEDAIGTDNYISTGDLVFFTSDADAIQFKLTMHEMLVAA